MQNKITVLLLDGQNVQSISVARSLREAGYRVFAMMDSRMSFGYVSTFINKKFRSPSLIHDPDKYETALYDLLSRKSIEVIIPIGNESAEFLSRRKELIEERHHLKCAIPTYEIFRKANDKELLMSLCREWGIPHPRTHSLNRNNVAAAVNYVGFPALIKPNISVGARGIMYVQDTADILEKLDDVETQFGACTMQEFVNHTGVYYNVMIYRAKNGRITNHTVIKIKRYFPLKGGSSCYCESVENPGLVEICSQTLERLNWIGFADFDVMEEAGTGAMKIIEINPRIPASVHAAWISGVNFPAAIVSDELGLSISEYEYHCGKKLRFMGLDIMWFIFSPQRFRFKPSWFRFFGKDLHYQDGCWRDPLPMFMGCVAGVIKYLDPAFRRSKLKS